MPVSLRRAWPPTPAMRITLASLLALALTAAALASSAGPPPAPAPAGNDRPLIGILTQACHQCPGR
jgi:hypothetical protein